MTEEKIREIVAKIRALIPGKNDWRTLLDSTAEQAADALESLLAEKVTKPECHLNFVHYEAFADAGRIIDEQMAEFRESLHKALSVPIQEAVKRVVVPLTEPVSIKKALLAGEVAKVERAIAGETAAFLVNIQLTGWRAQPQFTEGFVQGFNFGAEAMLEAINARNESEVASDDVQVKVPKGWTLVPDLMNADMVNAWSGGPAVSSDSVALRTSFQEGWKRVLAFAPKYTPECGECKDTGYIPDGNHCMACSEPATAQAIYQVGTKISNGVVWGDVPFGIFTAKQKEKHAQLRVVYDMPPTEVKKTVIDPTTVTYATLSEAIESCWMIYQEGKGSADHTDKQVFAQALKSFADWLDAVARVNQQERAKESLAHMTKVLNDEGI